MAPTAVRFTRRTGEDPYWRVKGTCEGLAWRVEENKKEKLEEKVEVNEFLFPSPD